MALQAGADMVMALGTDDEQVAVIHAIEARARQRSASMRTSFRAHANVAR